MISTHNAIVSPLVRDELREVIERPAEAAGGRFETGLVEELLGQVVGQPGALPLLQYVLWALWQRRECETLTWAAYRDVGGVEGALAAGGDALLKERYADEERRDAIRGVLLRLVQPGEGAVDTRRRVRLIDLAPADSGVEAVQTLIQPFVDGRLLTTGRDTVSGAETVEIAHEALITAWPTFGQWIGTARGEMRRLIQLQEAAEQWEANEESEDFLWGGLRLATAEAQLQQAAVRLNVREQRFLEASRAREEAQRAAAEAAAREHEEQRQRELVLAQQAQEAAEARTRDARQNLRRLQVLLVVAGVLLVVALGATWFAVVRQQAADRSAKDAQAAAQKEAVARQASEAQTRLAQAQARASEALFDSTQGGVDQGLLLARAAVPVSTTVILTDTTTYPLVISRALQEALSATSPNVRLTGHRSSVTAVVFSPDGKTVLTGSSDKTARLWDTASGQALHTLQGHTREVSAVAFSPDDKTVLTGSGDTTVRVWVVNTPLLVAETTRRLCTSHVFNEDTLKDTIPGWRGCDAELKAWKPEQDAYDRLTKQWGIVSH